MDTDQPDLRVEIHTDIPMRVHQLLTDGDQTDGITVRTLDQLLADAVQPDGVTTSSLTTTWIYRMADPYALCMQIHHPDGEVTPWYLSRDSLLAAVSTAAELTGQEGNTGLVTFGLADGDVTDPHALAPPRSANRVHLRHPRPHGAAPRDRGPRGRAGKGSGMNAAVANEAAVRVRVALLRQEADRLDGRVGWIDGRITTITDRRDQGQLSAPRASQSLSALQRDRELAVTAIDTRLTELARLPERPIKADVVSNRATSQCAAAPDSAARSRPATRPRQAEIGVCSVPPDHRPVAQRHR